MPMPIELNQVFTLATLHLVIGIILYGIGHILLPKSSRLPLAGILVLVWLWSVTALWTFYQQNMSFLGWFFDPSGEKNSTALLNTLFLMLIALASLSLLWARLKDKQYWRVLYWLLVSILIAFLALDEFFSLHETIVFWRGGYLILGGTVGLVTLFMISRSKPDIRKILLMFVIGLGIMGVSGVVLDAFSTQNLLDIGPLKFTFIRCRGEFLGVYCRDFSNTEELMELYGSGIMWLSLMALITAYWREPQQQTTQHRWVIVGGLVWVLSLMGWMWLVPSLQARLATPATTDYGDMSLLAYDLNTHSVVAGDTLKLTLYMQAHHDLSEDYSMSVHLYTQALPDIDSIEQDDMTLGNFTYPTRAWIPNLAVRNHFQLTIPDDIATNQSYQLIAILWQGDLTNRIPIQETILPIFSDGTTLVLDGIAAPASDTPPVTTSLSYNFSADFSLAGYDLPDSVRIGEDVTLDFWWQADSDIDVTATQFLHWFNTDTEEFFIFDQIPFAGYFPTQDWVAGMLVQDSWTVTIPDDIPAGTYRVQTGMFELATAERIPVSDSTGTPVTDNSIVLGEVMIEGE